MDSHLVFINYILITLSGFYASIIVNANPESLHSLLIRYELSSLKILTPLAQTGSNNISPSVILNFNSFDKDILLTARPRNLPLAIVKIVDKYGFIVHTTKTTDYNSGLYVGKVNGDCNSRVEGFFMKTGFHGIVETGNETYFLEPAISYFTHVSESNDTIVYRSSDIRKCWSDNRLCRKMNDFLQFEDSVNNGKLQHVGSKDFLKEDISTVPLDGITSQKKYGNRARKRCEVELVADHTYVAHLKYNIADILTTLFFHAKRADSFFKRADFDSDGIPDRIRIIPTQVVIYYSGETPNYPLADVQSNDATDFIVSFSRRAQNFCVSICFCHTAFKGDVVGMAYRPNPDDPKSVGGICQRPLFMRDGTLYTPNTAIVSSQGHSGQLPFSVTSHSLTHELGHSFGSSHDPPDNLLCSPKDWAGNYLMTPYTIDGSKERHKMFSPCSRDDIQRIIHKNGECLRTSRTPVCGNGIREEGEECDCGSYLTCDSLDPCCTPMGGYKTDKQCTFRRQMKAECSFVESPCCTAKCRIVKKFKQRFCTTDPTICEESICDGTSPECPPGKLQKDGTPCRGTSQTCQGGMCNSSVCLDNGLEECTCELKSECHICCLNRSTNMCKSAKYWGLTVSRGRFFLKPVGSSCYRNSGICNSKGECRRSLGNGKDANASLYAWCATVLVVALLLIFMLFIARSCIQRCFGKISKKCHVYILPSGVELTGHPTL